MIATALQEVGPARSIVIDEDDIIRAGNGVQQAALKAGYTKLQIVEADGETLVAVRRRGLSARAKRRLALFDNRTAETAEWDRAVLSDIFNDDPSALEGLWSDGERKELLNELAQTSYQLVLLVFVPEEIKEIEAAFDQIALMAGGDYHVWLARLKEYDKVMNAMASVVHEGDLRNIQGAIKYLVKFWREHQATDAAPESQHAG